MYFAGASPRQLHRWRVRRAIGHGARVAQPGGRWRGRVRDRLHGRRGRRCGRGGRGGAARLGRADARASAPRTSTASRQRSPRAPTQLADAIVLETGKLRSEAKTEVQTLLNRFDLVRGRDGRRPQGRAGRARRAPALPGARRRRRDRPVQLPAPPVSRARRARAARRQHGRRQAERHHAARRPALRRGRARREAAAGRVQPRRRRPATVGAAMVAQPAPARPVLHRQLGGRPPHPRGRASIGPSCSSRSRWAARTRASSSTTRRCARPCTRSSSAATCRRASAAPAPSACSCIARSPTASSTRSRSVVRELQVRQPRGPERCSPARSPPHGALTKVERALEAAREGRRRADRRRRASCPGGYYRTASLHRLPDGVHHVAGYTDVEVFGPDLVRRGDRLRRRGDRGPRREPVRLRNAVFTGSPRAVRGSSPRARAPASSTATARRTSRARSCRSAASARAATTARPARGRIATSPSPVAVLENPIGAVTAAPAPRAAPAGRTISIGSSASTPPRRPPRPRATLRRPAAADAHPAPARRQAARERGAARAALRRRSRAEGEEAAGVRSPALGRTVDGRRSIASRSPCSTA